MLQSIILPKEGKVITDKVHVLYKDDPCKKHDFHLIASKNVFQCKVFFTLLCKNAESSCTNRGITRYAH